MANPKMNSEQLWRYVDGLSSAAERQQVEDAVAADAGLAAELKEIKSIDQSFGAISPDQPSLRFSKNILEKLPPAAQRLKRLSFFSSRAKRWWGVAAMIVLLVSSYFVFFPQEYAWLGMAKEFLPEQAPTWDIGFTFNANLGYLLGISLAVLAVLLVDHWFNRRQPSAAKRLSSEK